MRSVQRIAELSFLFLFSMLLEFLPLIFLLKRHTWREAGVWDIWHLLTFAFSTVFSPALPVLTSDVPGVRY
jgi:hypothetical protein